MNNQGGYHPPLIQKTSINQHAIIDDLLIFIISEGNNNVHVLTQVTRLCLKMLKPAVEEIIQTFKGFFMSARKRKQKCKSLINSFNDESHFQTIHIQVTGL